MYLHYKNEWPAIFRNPRKNITGEKIIFVNTAIFLQVIREDYFLFHLIIHCPLLCLENILKLLSYKKDLINANVYI